MKTMVTEPPGLYSYRSPTVLFLKGLIPGLPSWVPGRELAQPEHL